MRAPTVDDRCVLLYTARFILRADDPEVVVKRLTCGRIASLSKKGLWLVEQYMEVMPELLMKHPLPLAEREADQIVCARHGWPTMESLGYTHKFPDLPEKGKPKEKSQ